MLINTLVIGLGNIGFGYDFDPLIAKRIRYPTHVKAILNHPNFNLYGVCDLSRAARSKFANKYKDIEIFDDWRVAILGEPYDLVVVATNTESHFKIVSGVIEAGCKNILCEKPLSYDMKQALEMVKKCQRAKVNLIVDYFREFNPSYIRLFDFIKDRGMGRLQSFSGKYSRGIYNNGTDLFQLLLKAFGPIKRVAGLANPLVGNFGAVDPTISVVMTFKNGVSGFIEGIDNNYYNIFELDLMFEKGRIRIENDKLDFFVSGESKLVSGNWALLPANSKRLSLVMEDGLMPVYDKISEIISGKKLPLLVPAESLDVMKVASTAISNVST